MYIRCINFVRFVPFGLLFLNMLRNFRFISSAHVLTFPSTDGRVSALPVTNPGNEAYFSRVSEPFIISLDFSFHL